MTMVALLEDNGLNFCAKEEDFYNFTISFSKGEKPFDEIVEWLKANVKKI